MQTFARIENGRIVELLASPQDPKELFHPLLQWRSLPADISDRVTVNWTCSNGEFSPPSQTAPDHPPVSLGSLLSDIETLKRAVAALAPRA